MAEVLCSLEEVFQGPVPSPERLLDCWRDYLAQWEEER